MTFRYNLLHWMEWKKKKIGKFFKLVFVREEISWSERMFSTTHILVICLIRRKIGNDELGDLKLKIQAFMNRSSILTESMN